MHFDSPDIQYPVGVELNYNIPIIKKMAKAIKIMYPTERIYLWCRGSSGSIIASIIASNLGSKRKVYINYIRKPNESRHSGRTEIGEYGKSVNIVVDDFIGTGETIESIINNSLDQLRYKGYPKDYKLDCLCITGVIKYSILTQFQNVITNRD